MAEAEIQDEAEGQAPLKRRKIGWTDTISVLVGPDEQAFTVHKDAICATSKFFAAACSVEWEEGRQRKVCLPETNPTAFEVYVRCVYRQGLKLEDLEEFDREEGIPARCWPSFKSLGLLWALADMLIDHRLCNLIANQILKKKYRKYNACPGATSTSFIWSITSDKAKIRSLLRDIVVASKGSWLEQDEHYPRAILSELSQRFVNGEGRDDVEERLDHRCNYHIHEAGQEKCT